MKVTICYELPVASTTMSDVCLDTDGGTLTLRFSFNREGVIFRSGLQFHRVRAHRHRAELYVSAEQIEVAYDVLVELANSPWIEELRSVAPADQRDSWILRHYLIVFDSSGCFEVVADSWDVLPEEPGSWIGANWT